MPDDVAHELERIDIDADGFVDRVFAHSRGDELGGDADAQLVARVAADGGLVVGVAHSGASDILCDRGDSVGDCNEDPDNCWMDCGQSVCLPEAWKGPTKAACAATASAVSACRPARPTAAQAATACATFRRLLELLRGSQRRRVQRARGDENASAGLEGDASDDGLGCSCRGTAGHGGLAFGLAPSSSFGADDMLDFACYRAHVFMDMPVKTCP